MPGSNNALSQKFVLVIYVGTFYIRFPKYYFPSPPGFGDVLCPVQVGYFEASECCWCKRVKRDRCLLDLCLGADAIISFGNIDKLFK